MLVLVNADVVLTYMAETWKGKFSSGREGALASKFNYDFK